MVNFSERQVHKGFLSVGGKLLHYRWQGEGPAVIMLHAAPCSLRVMETLQQKWSKHFTTIAFDLPGFGLSELAAQPEISTADLADSIAGAIRVFDLSKVMLYGRHTGAGVAVELARRHPSLCSMVLTDGFPVFAKPYTPERLSEYLTPIVPTWDGGHLTWAWFRYREQHMFWPWDRPSLSQRADTDLPDIDFLYRGATELLSASETYAKVYASAFRHAGLAMIHEVEVPVIYGNRPGDSQYKTVPLYPETANVRIFSRDHEKAAEEELMFLLEHAPDVVAPAHPKVSIQAAKCSRLYLDTRNGPTYLRADGMDQSGLLTVFLPDLPGSIDLHIEDIEALALNGPVIAIDPWGNGQSILRPEDPVSIDLWIDQITEILDQLDVGQIKLHAHGSSAAIALELSKRMPDMVAELTLRSPPALEIDDLGTFAQDYAPDITPEWAGGNFLKLWHHLRDQELWWPWNCRTIGHSRKTEPRINPAWLHRRAVVLLRQPAHYREIWRVVLSYPVAERLASGVSRCQIVSQAEDLFGFTADRARSLAAMQTQELNVQ